MIYFNLTPSELIRQVMSKGINAKQQKDGKLMVQVTSAWQWDECPLANSGGQCFYFEPHEGQKISCLADLKNMDRVQHPNMKKIPAEDELRFAENEIIRLIVGGLKYA